MLHFMHSQSLVFTVLICALFHKTMQHTITCMHVSDENYNPITLK